MGSPSEFGWLAITNVTSPWQATESRYEIPAALWRLASARSLTLNPQKFDFGRRSRLPTLRMTGLLFLCCIR